MTTRKIAFTNSYAAINGTLISPSTASYTAQALFNNYTFTIANNFNISTTNGISEYMQEPTHTQGAQEGQEELGVLMMEGKEEQEATDS